MSDSDDKPEIPSWQRSAEAQPEPEHSPAADATPAPDDDKIEVARRFLEDDSVKDAPRERKEEFLRAKGIEVEDIQTLLGEAESPSSTPTETPSSTPEQPEEAPASSTATSDPIPSTTFLQPTADRPPIVTYPEFLTKPTRPPPLVTTTRLLTTLYSAAGLSTLLYAASKYIVAPMVAAQTEARTDLHAITASKLDALVTKLESSVSSLPTSPTAEDSDSEDPSEMFHRDMGTQTSPVLGARKDAAEDDDPTRKHAALVGKLRKNLGDLRDGVRAQSEDMEDIKALVDVFRDELDSMTYAGQNEYMSGYDIYGRNRKAEPEDEIKRVRDNIRRVKGVLLSTRNFPR